MNMSSLSITVCSVLVWSFQCRLGGGGSSIPWSQSLFLQPSTEVHWPHHNIDHITLWPDSTEAVFVQTNLSLFLKIIFYLAKSHSLLRGKCNGWEVLPLSHIGLVRKFLNFKYTVRIASLSDSQYLPIIFQNLMPWKCD